ncbi:MAG: ExbD/TolR family protein [Gammaproteobacteria bacterium]
MARRRFEKPAEEAEINITPMLDMVFILLIFFIVTTSFVHETGLHVSRPSTSTQKVVKESKVVLIEIASDGTIQIDGQTIDPSALRAEVQKDLAANPTAQVVVAASPGSHAGSLVNAIDQAKQAGATKVSIATTAS